MRRDLVVAVGVVLSVWLVPFTVAFKEEIDESGGIFLTMLDPLERILDVIFIFHLVVEFRTAYVDTEEKVVVVSGLEPVSHELLFRTERQSS